MTERELFIAALQIDPTGRPALFDRECGGEPGLRNRVEKLLAAYAEAGSAFGPEKETTDANAASPAVPADGPGRMIAGRYKLLEEIGEGGMGTVWVAEQTTPVRRKVALKLIKAGMDSRSVLARFEAERQALALMDHPNIAKVLDGGLTESGRPFFVMEYVKGVPITEFCDAARLSVEERLNLFIQVCSALQHAHQKGIIHRDLKPSNILVAPYDDKPVPKVIDFGLAKAMHQSLTENTLYTAHEMVLGTPLYMSPEQAQLNNLDIDTRADIYSLGVLLYELLTGTTPLVVYRECLGVVLESMNRLAEAEAEYRKALTLVQELSEDNPDVIEFRAFLSILHGNVGAMLSNTGRPAEAETELRKAVVGQTLADEHPDALLLRNNLAVGHNHLGNLMSNTGRPAEAEAEYRTALAVFQKLADEGPDVTEFRSRLANSHNMLGRLLARGQRFPEAFTALETGLAIRQKLVDTDLRNTTSTDLAESYAYRGGARSLAGQPAEAAADLRRAIELWSRVPNPDAETRRERARTMAMLAGLAKNPKSGVTGTEAATFAGQTLAALRDAVTAGWTSRDELKQPEFDSLRNREDFKKLVMEVEAKVGRKSNVKQ